MNRDIKQILKDIYIDHKLKESDLDYSIAEKYKSDLNQLSQLNNCCFFIVDLHKMEYLFTSDNFKNIFGYLPAKKNPDDAADNLFLDSKIHPDDFAFYKKIQMEVGQFILSQPKEERINYKHVFELRVQNIQGEYVRVSWERQALETDKSGNLWLMLGIINVSPYQSDTAAIKSFFVNLKTGQRIDFNSSNKPPFELTARENEVLKHIQHGLLSKEIAEKLSISINTVNIHRQNILQKMNVDNSLEAVNYARKLGILE